VTPNQRFFWIGCAFEFALCIVAVALNALLRQPLWSDLRWNAQHSLAGAIAALPTLGLFLLTVHAASGPLGRLKDFLNAVVRPLFQTWAWWQLLLISILAGLGEELLFRGVIQGNLTRWLGLLPGLILASLLFGACHPMTLSYLMITTLIGVYLGTLWIVTGNLLAPVITHALYDFVALIYFLRYTKS
jgi:membrane protease YdiL (CAAX protease family)